MRSFYIDDCISLCKLIPLSLAHLIHAKEETKEMLKEFADKFGDSYMQDLSDASLISVFGY